MINTAPHRVSLADALAVFSTFDRDEGGKVVSGWADSKLN